MPGSREYAIVGAWLRLDLRRRWRSLAVLALLIAVAGGTVMSAVAGARRGETSNQRLWAAGTLPATAAVLPNQPGFDWDAVAAIPGVEAVGRFCGSLRLDGIADSDDVVFTGCDLNLGSTLERPLILRGRRPDPNRLDEAMASPRFLDRNHLDVGDTVTGQLFSISQIAAYRDTGIQPEVPDGPVIPMRIVGTGRSPWYYDRANEPGGLAPSGALALRYPKNMMADDANALVRLAGGESGLPAFEQQLAKASGRSDIDVWNLPEMSRHQERVAAFEARCLLAFGLAALLAAVVLIGQAIIRSTTASVADLAVLGTLGMTRPQAVLAAIAGPVLSAIAGTLAGMGIAVAASRFFPIGTASASEPAPGIDADILTLAAGAIGIPLLVTVGAAVATWLAVGAGRLEGARRSRVALAAARLGMPVPVVVGTRFALEPGRGPAVVPVRSALAGAVVGVLGVIAALTFAHAVDDAASNPRRFGQTHSLESAFGFDGHDFVPSGPVLAAVARVPGVTGVNDTRFAVAKAGPSDLPVQLHSYAPVGRPLDVILTAGRLPRAGNEVVLAGDSAQRLGVSTGDVVRFQGSRSSAQLTVSGIGFVPITFHNGYSTGGWVGSASYTKLFSQDKAHYGMLSVTRGADLDEVQAGIARALATVHGAQGASFAAPGPPAQLAEIRQVRLLPLVLGAFLAVLSVAAVGHALATAVRRRRYDIAILRALGMTRWQCRWIVVTQATVLAAAGLVLGVPLGLAAGRVVWRVVADYTPLQYVAPLAVWALLLVIPVALLMANLLAAWPGYQAARLRVAHVLRAE